MMTVVVLKMCKMFWLRGLGWRDGHFFANRLALSQGDVNALYRPSTVATGTGRSYATMYLRTALQKLNLDRASMVL